MNIIGVLLSIISLTEGGLLRKTENFLRKVEKEHSEQKNFNKLRTNFRSVSRDLLNRGAINSFKSKLDPYWY